MSEIDKKTLVITKLIQETQRGSIFWDSFITDTIKLSNEGEIIGKVYLTEYKNIKFRLYRYTFKEIKGGFFETYSERQLSDVKLEILDQYGDLDWEFPSDNSLEDLYEAVRYKVANVKGLFDEILGLEIINATYESSTKSLDITIKIKELVVKNELRVIVSNNIAGDPDPGNVKILRIKYEINGSTKEKTYNEGQEVKIP